MPEYTARTLTLSAVPSLVVGEDKTKSSAIQYTQFKMTLGYWSGFEAEVRSHYQEIRWPRKVLVTYPDSDDDDDEEEDTIRYEDEIYGCGDEQSVVGRFANNVGHVMGNVYAALGTHLRFSDWKATPNPTLISGNGTQIPDLAIWAPRSSRLSQSTLLVVGEAKTPWMHSISKAMANEATIRRYFGQIAEYMHMTGCKYGFLTTYDETVFLKQEPHPRDARKSVLWHSNVIRGDTFSQDLKTRNLLDFHGQVSLRECFLYFGLKAREEPNIANSTPRSTWVYTYHPTYTAEFISEHKGVVPTYRTNVPPVPRLPPQAPPAPRNLRSRTARATECEQTQQDVFSHTLGSHRSIGLTTGPYPLSLENDTHRGSPYGVARQEGELQRLSSSFEPMSMDDSEPMSGYASYGHGRAHGQGQQYSQDHPADQARGQWQPHSEVYGEDPIYRPAHGQSQGQQLPMPVTDKKGRVIVHYDDHGPYFKSKDGRSERVTLKERMSSKGKIETYFKWEGVRYVVKE